jgi:hypothetical protein
MVTVENDSTLEEVKVQSEKDSQIIIIWLRVCFSLLQHVGGGVMLSVTVYVWQWS